MNTTLELTEELIDEFVGVSHGDFEKVKALLAKHPSLLNVYASWGETPLQAAAHTANRPIAEYLLAAGAPLDICTAAMLGMKDKVRDFLHIHPQLCEATGAHGFPVLYYAVISGQHEIAEMLLAEGADINAGAGRSTPLHGAAIFGQTAMAEWLIVRGAYLNLPDYEDKTPLDRAEDSGHWDIAALLERYGAELSAIR